MHNKMVRQAVSDFTQALGDKSFQRRFSLTKKALAAAMKGADWPARLAPLFPIRERLSCAVVLDCCGQLLNRLAPEPEEGWLSFTFRYARDLMFPDNDFAPYAARHQDGALVFLALLQTLFDWERRALPFDPMMDFALLTDEELEQGGFDHAGDYRRFLAAFRGEYVYELLRLAREVTPFSTLEHVAGVHHVAMTAARGLYAGGAPVDLSLISGAAAGHDFGKFGCKPGERVPYLHYYYTDRWFTARQMQAVGHIAANHSTWDLELENLSAESLCLIYADFRVKQSRDEAGRERTVIYPLDQSFDVILQKLDNVDDAKRRRYEFVYEKLHDFEDYMRLLGVDVALTGQEGRPRPQKDVALMDAGEVIHSLVLLSVEHNLRLMHRLSSSRQFGNILEAARSEKNWERLRAYLNIFDESVTYLSPSQKIQALAFLYELLMHREGDIRRQAAALIGNIIARFRMGYRKELPADAAADEGEQTPFTLWSKYLELFIYPDHKITAQHKSRIGYTLKIMVDSALDRCRAEDAPRFIAAVLEYYADPAAVTDDEAVFALLDSMLYLRPDFCDDAVTERLVAFAAHHAGRGQLRLTAAALRYLVQLSERLPKGHPLVRQVAAIARSTVCDGNVTLTFLQYKILSQLGLGASCQAQVLYLSAVSDIFLDNLKAATPWIVKAVNIQLLLDALRQGRRDHILHIAAHLSNLIKVSEWVVVRHEAGAALLSLMPLLSLDQRNEICVELAKGLEVGEQEFSKYIPEYLGQAALFLHPKELQELIGRFKELLGSSNDWIVSVTLHTLGVLLSRYPAYRERFEEAAGEYEARKRLILGLLLEGLANYRDTVRQEALLVLGKTVFGSEELPAEEKEAIFALCLKKLLFLITEEPGRGLAFFYRAAALSHIYRFIALHRLNCAEFSFERRDKVAFFPGTFDPFTLSHKGIVRAIRDLGFEVYLAVDEFSWSKKTQPHLIRRQIVSMSVADEFHVHLFPDELPVNLANPGDLKRLRQLFEGRELYMVVGSDVVRNASSYRAEPQPWSVHSMNHIVFSRVSGEGVSPPEERQALSAITGRLIELSLPPHLEDISSSRIRENIDLNRDISNLIDPAVQEFIYQNSLYLREPQYKPVMTSDTITLERVDCAAPALLAELRASVLEGRPEAASLCDGMLRNGDGLVVMRSLADHSRPVGYLSFRQITADGLYAALRRNDLADYVRRRASGSILLMSGIYTRFPDRNRDAVQLLLTEALTRALADGCGCGLFLPYVSELSASVGAALERQGFAPVPGAGEGLPLYMVDMRAPVALIQNLETTIKEPFSSNDRVLIAVKRAHARVQQAVSGLYPGTLVLSLSAGMMHHRLVDKITQLNSVPPVPTRPRVLGRNMCVPFGKILRGKVVPNTVTKTVHTDKVYDPSIIRSAIEAFPYYSPIPSQIRTIKSFGRPAILVDDLMHGGDRILALDPLLRREGIDIKMVLVGVLSGRGRDLMARQDYPVDCVYYVPNLRRWFVESTLYPFIGGDTVRRDSLPIPGLQPSVNRILPYATPECADECRRDALFAFSRCCLENARDILLVLEAEYRELFARNLTLSRLSEAVILPLCPDKGGCMAYDANLSASVYLENDLEMLMRTQMMF